MAETQHAGMRRTRTTQLRMPGARNKRGQAISEYGMILAFVAILVALVFVWAPGKVGPAIDSAFSSMANQLNLLVQESQNPS